MKFKASAVSLSWDTGHNLLSEQECASGLDLYIIATTVLERERDISRH